MYKWSGLTDACELFYASVLSLWIIYNIKQTNKYAQRYAQKSLRSREYKTKQSIKGDLTNLITDINYANREHDLTKLEERQWQNVLIKIGDYQTFITRMKENNLKEATFKNYIRRLEQQLQIRHPSLINTRILAETWPTQEIHRKRLAFTRLEQYLSKNGRQMDFYKTFKDLRTMTNLYITTAYNAERRQPNMKLKSRLSMYDRRLRMA